MEHAGLGKPQVVSAVGGLTKFPGNSCSNILIEPRYSLCVGQQSEAIRLLEMLIRLLEMLKTPIDQLDVPGGSQHIST
jgi:hypothetical protein